MPRRVLRVPLTIAAAHVLVYAGGVSPVLAAPLADSPPTIASVRTPKVVVLPASTRTSVTTNFRITLRVKDSDGVDTVVAGLYAPGSKRGIAVRGTRTGKGVWTATARLNGTQPVGTWRVQAFATDTEQHTSDPSRVYTTYEVRTPTRITDFDMGEPVEADKPLKVAGKLQRWMGNAGWKPYADREVTLQFRPAGGKSFAVVDTLRTRDDGSVAAAKATAGKPGTWRISFAGFETRAASVSREDEVKPTEPKKDEERGPEVARPTPGATSGPSPVPTASANPTPSSRPTVSPRSTVSPRPTMSPRPAVSRQPERSRPRQPAAGTSSAGSLGVRSGVVSR